MDSTRFDQAHLSQPPPVNQLAAFGFTYLTPEEALAARQGKIGNVLLEDILKKQLMHINRIPYKGDEYRFTEENIRVAIEKLKSVKYEGLCKTNETVYEQLTLGLSLEQLVEGHNRSFTLRYIDWQNWMRNVFHVAVQFPVTGQQGAETLQLGIVLFVNGIPLVVIECAPPHASIDRAIAQSIRNQQESCSPSPSNPNLSSQNLLNSNIFSYAQIVVATNEKITQFGTIGAPARFWSVWKEQDWKEGLGKDLKDSAPPDIISSREPSDGSLSSEELSSTNREMRIYDLCHPERLLEFIYKFTLFDNGIKKIARYHQYFAVKRILSRVRVPDAEGRRRRGGIVWHTQGSGKSLTMVMLARSLAEEPGIVNPRIVLVTDRKDLDEQIKDTFAACDMAPQRAKTGRDLLELVSEQKASIITTLVHKFDKALNIRKYQDDSIDIFMLIDESHRTQFGAFAARMRQMFPNACYLGFTGTPLMKKEKNNFAKFGGLIDCYTISEAIQDKAIVPLLYEGRHVEIHPDKPAIDVWFERHTRGLTDTAIAALKKRYARAEWLNKADKILYLQALDISRHFRSGWRDRGCKGQLVASSKAIALSYHRHLTEIGLVSSEIIISPPNNHTPLPQIHLSTGNSAPVSRENTLEETCREEVDGSAPASSDDVSRFWRKTIRHYGSEEEYNKQIINRFKHRDNPEILIVVDKLQTGFDAPRNTVLYITRTLRGHTLLQTIARVNRIHEDEHGRPKSFGLIVDYVGILGELDKALTQYSAFEGFDDEDLTSVLVSVHKEIGELPQRHTDLRALFTNDRGKFLSDEEIRRRLLYDEALQHAFRERLSRFYKTLDIALTNDTFLANTLSEEQSRYQYDCKRFEELKTIIDHRDHEPRIEEMLDTCIQANEAVQLHRPYPFPIAHFYRDPFLQEIEISRSTYKPSPAARAHTIAKAARATLAQHKECDPAFYDKFSNLIEQVIDDFKAKRLSDIECLERIARIHARVEKHEHKDIPTPLRGNDNAIAFYRVLKPYFAIPGTASDVPTDAPASHDTAAASEAAIMIDNIFQHHWKVRFWDDQDIIKQVINDIDDYFYDEVARVHGFHLSVPQMDKLLDKVMRVARYRIPAYSERKGP
uniref:Type I restriction enzyme endonuclease subunit n=1 Tax=Candidatus Kentrum eta TaxID=2126337 RepID=A0A450V4V7_9GAMM|nr:MAG: type I restriction enzyme, R subunit [Candidatus Kentron sp. H]VFJ99963.1 MAG: type I restriction enzyme, R subunit [Candidatus Kentron sp. H]VFK04000.1 MAG: type I restriction enzyme, R subunit [Candidatus Kentron sp. H]